MRSLFSNFLKHARHLIYNILLGALYIIRVKVDFDLVQNVARATTTLLKLNRFLLGSIREPLTQNGKGRARDVLRQVEIHPNTVLATRSRAFHSFERFPIAFRYRTYNVHIDDSLSFPNDTFLFLFSHFCQHISCATSPIQWKVRLQNRRE